MPSTTPEITDAPGTLVTAEAAEPRPSPGATIRGALERASGLFVWAGLIVLFAVWVPDTFLTNTTAKAIAGDQAITIILALGVLFTLAAGEFDLSIAQNLGLSAVVAASLMVKSDLAPVIAVVLTLGMGVLIGAVNGFVVAAIGVNSFIATLGMSSVLLAFTSIVSGDTYTGPVPEGFQSIASSQPL